MERARVPALATGHRQRTGGALRGVGAAVNIWDTDPRDLGRDPRDYPEDSPWPRREPDNDNAWHASDASKAMLGAAAALLIAGAFLLYLALRHGVAP